jgi:hypothetical protein
MYSVAVVGYNLTHVTDSAPEVNAIGATISVAPDDVPADIVGVAPIQYKSMLSNLLLFGIANVVFAEMLVFFSTFKRGAMLVCMPEIALLVDANKLANDILKLCIPAPISLIICKYPPVADVVSVL